MLDVAADPRRAQAVEAPRRQRLDGGQGGLGFHDDEGVRREIAEPPVSPVEQRGERADPARGKEVEEPDDVPDERLWGVHRQSPAVHHADAEDPLARGLPVPAHLEERVVSPDHHEARGHHRDVAQRLRQGDGDERDQLEDPRDQRHVEQEGGEPGAQARRDQLDQHVLGTLHDRAAAHAPSSRLPNSHVHIAANRAAATAIFTAYGTERADICENDPSISPAHTSSTAQAQRMRKTAGKASRRAATLPVSPGMRRALPERSPGAPAKTVAGISRAPWGPPQATKKGPAPSIRYWAATAPRIRPL